MLRVVFDTRIEVNGVPEVARLEKIICPQDLNMAKEVIAGRPVVRLVSIEEVKTAPVPRPKKRKAPAARDESWRLLHSQLTRRISVSKYHLVLGDLLEQMARDMEWDAVVRRAGFRGRPFRELWLKFKESSLVVLWFSPHTRNMIKRVEQESWLAPHIEPKE